MSKTPLAYTCWQDEGMWLGCLDEYPDYMTQGETMEELKENLTDIQKEFTCSHIWSKFCLKSFLLL